MDVCVSLEPGSLVGDRAKKIGERSEPRGDWGGGGGRLPSPREGWRGDGATPCPSPVPARLTSLADIFAPFSPYSPLRNLVPGYVCVYAVINDWKTTDWATWPLWEMLGKITEDLRKLSDYFRTIFGIFGTIAVVIT